MAMDVKFVAAICYPFPAQGTERRERERGMNTATGNILSLPHHPRPASSRGCNGQTLPFPKFSVAKYTPFSCASSSSQSPTTVEEEIVSPSDSLPLQSQFTDSDALPPTSGCKACGREELEKGCNGEGRIQGGIATFPGFGWWPIKAFRPCPGFVACGGRYRRRGQTMDEVGFGGGNK